MLNFYLFYTNLYIYNNVFFYFYNKYIYNNKKQKYTII